MLFYRNSSAIRPTWRVLETHLRLQCWGYVVVGDGLPPHVIVYGKVHRMSKRKRYSRISAEPLDRRPLCPKAKRAYNSRRRAGMR
jgi:hypothetical protein